MHVILLYVRRSFPRTSFGCPPHLKKRKLEAASSELPTGAAVLSVPSKMFSATEAKEEESTAAKRRKKSVTTTEESRRDADSPPKPLILPQKKRVIPATSPAKKKQLAAASADEPVDDETLIRETEAALKSLSGSWPGPRGSAYPRGMPDHNESPTFENLFEEKKANAKLSPTPSATTSGEGATSSIKDVITLRDPHSEDKSPKSSPLPASSTKSSKGSAKSMNELENLMKIENDCVSIQNTGIKGRKHLSSGIKIEGTAQYEPPDFNELVDDSSNELEIDMSDPCADRDTDGDDKLDDGSSKLRRHKELSEDSSKRSRYGELQTNQPGYVQSTYGSSQPFSSASSAFRPPNVDTNKAQRAAAAGGGSGMPLPTLGPFPAEATFVGYPETLPNIPSTTTTNTMSSESDKLSRGGNPPIKPISATSSSPKEPSTLSTNTTEASSVGKPPTTSSVSVASPDTKQYTILQPAAGSRAASALQDIASREGVQVVSAVSSGGPSTTTPSQPSLSQHSQQSATVASTSSVANQPYDRSTGTLSPTSMGRG